MKNNSKTQYINTIDSVSYKSFVEPDYPDYPDCDDIYNTHLERQEFDSKYIFGTKAAPQVLKKHERIQKSH
jgi:hypothetical protein